MVIQSLSHVQLFADRINGALFFVYLSNFMIFSIIKIVLLHDKKIKIFMRSVLGFFRETEQIFNAIHIFYIYIYTYIYI